MAKPERSEAAFESRLSEGRQRFLARLMVFAFADGWRSPGEFLRDFPPREIMRALKDADELRSRLLVMAAGVHERLALKKSITSAGEDLALALEEGVTDAASVLEILTPDDRVRYLDARKLWEFLHQDAFWQSTANKPGHGRSAARMTFLLERALEENLLTLRDIADGVTFDEIAERLPPEKLKQVVTHALQRARRGEALDEESLLEIVPLGELIESVPLLHVWTNVVLDKIALPLELATPEAKQEASRALSAVSPAVSAPPPAPAPAPGKPAQRKQEATPRQPQPSESEINVELNELEFEAPPTPVDAGPFEQEARAKAVESLQALDRLPPSHAELALPILLSIESMYADLLEATTDEDREAVIRESFPNDHHLRTAMLALIEVLDPSINTKEPLIADAEIDSLIKIVLFEERHRYEQARGSRSGPPAARARSVPPPLPGRE